MYADSRRLWNESVKKFELRGQFDMASLSSISSKQNRKQFPFKRCLECEILFKPKSPAQKYCKRDCHLVEKYKNVSDCVYEPLGQRAPEGSSVTGKHAKASTPQELLIKAPRSRLVNVIIVPGQPAASAKKKRACSSSSGTSDQLPNILNKPIPLAEVLSPSTQAASNENHLLSDELMKEMNIYIENNKEYASFSASVNARPAWSLDGWEENHSFDFLSDLIHQPVRGNANESAAGSPPRFTQQPAMPSCPTTVSANDKVIELSSDSDEDDC